MIAQLNEVLLLDGVPRDMRTIPELPARHARIVELPHWAEEEAEDAVIVSTACWRQYIATWEIRDGRLYLHSIRGRYALVGEERIWATWYSGDLHVCGTANGNGVPAGGEDLVLTVRQGIVADTRRVSPPRDSRGEDARIWEDLTAFEDFEDEGY
ncbi:MAG: hypothetical protein RRA94_00925 [Bacteroidota bacterium]|nr:hypothetical protein [Bacteroidota bacterium]